MVMESPATAERKTRADVIRNRARLLDCATEAFSEKGIDASLEEIARQAGVGIGTLYRHFPTRDALIEAVYRNHVELLCNAVDELLAELPADQALAAWMQRFVSYVATKRGMASALHSMMGEDRSLFDDCRVQMNDAAARLLRAGRDAGVIRGDVEPADLLRAMGGICLATNEATWPDQARPLVSLLLDGLRFGAPAPG